MLKSKGVWRLTGLPYLGMEKVQEVEKRGRSSLGCFWQETCRMLRVWWGSHDATTHPRSSDKAFSALHLRLPSVQVEDRHPVMVP